MNNAAKRNSRVKREVITISDDESPNVQPAEKLVKGEDGGKRVSIPSVLSAASMIISSVTELQQKLEKKENMFKKACRAAREAELRAERAEDLLDSKRGIVDNAQKVDSLEKKNDELKQELATVSGQLNAWKAESETMAKKASELSQMNRKVKEELKTATSKEKESNMKILELRNQNFSLNEDLKMARAKEEGSVKKIAELELKIERQNLSLKADLKRMRETEDRLREVRARELDWKDQRRDELREMRRKRDDALDSVDELKKKNHKLKELLDKQGNGDSKIDAVENTRELQCLNQALQEELKRIRGHKQAENTMSLLQENLALKKQLDQARKLADNQISELEKDRKRRSLVEEADRARIDELSGKLREYERWMSTYPPASVAHLPPPQIPSFLPQPPSLLHIQTQSFFPPNQ